jgi:cell division protein ZapA (FtsZ GTPase activity inhibitor)
LSEQVTIGIIIADRTYPLKIEKGDEQLVRRCVKHINDKLSEFQGIYSGKDKQDFLAMSALMNLVDVFKSNSNLQQNLDEITARLKELDELITK